MSISTIEWTEQSWNPIVGCSLKSPGCTNCYAMKMAARIEAMNASARRGHETAPHYAGTTKKVNGRSVWTGRIAIASDQVLLAPLRRKKPTVYFVNSMGDLFHEDCPDEDIDRVFAVMALSPHHTFQVLTKRAARMRAYCTSHDVGGRWAIEASATDGKTFPLIKTAIEWSHHGLPNVWLGVSTERQQEADERIPLLLQTPAAIRFISYEPALGPLDLTSIAWGKDHVRFPESDDISDGFSALHPIGGKKLDWVIAGGESGPNARPMHPDWARSLRDQCAAASVDFFFKQWGEWAPYDRGQVDTRKLAIPKSLDGPVQRFGKKLAGRLLDGVEHNGMPQRRAAP